MAQEKAPAFQFYPKDFLTDSHVVAMTLSELGAYTRLLCFCWIDRSLPTDMIGLARLCRVSEAVFIRLWPALQPCFTEVDGRLVQARMEREREKQEQFRASRSANGRQGGRPKAPETTRFPHGKHTESTGEAKKSSPISDLQSPISDLQKDVPPPPDGRSKRPIFTGQRLTVFEWMFDDCKRTLGEHLDAFGLDEWFYDVDQRAVDQGLVIPKRDGGEWLQAQLVMEAQRRGIPLRFAAKPAAVSGSTCPHVPRCSSTTACIARTVADGRAARSA